jgi:hypothetical protein
VKLIETKECDDVALFGLGAEVTAAAVAHSVHFFSGLGAPPPAKFHQEHNIIAHWLKVVVLLTATWFCVGENRANHRLKLLQLGKHLGISSSSELQRA